MAVVVVAAVDVHVLAPVVGVCSAAETGGSGVAEAEGVGGEVELGVGVGGRGGGYAHGLVDLGLGFLFPGVFDLVLGSLGRIGLVW